MAGHLTARKVETAKPGKYGDGANLYLVVSKAGARKWVLRFTLRGKPKQMGRGSAASVPLADARENAARARRKIAQGINPIDERKREGGIPTFGEVADEVRQSLSEGFRNEKHKAQWKSTLENYAASLRAKPVDTIGTDDVLAALKPIWTIKAETGSRVRGRIEQVLDGEFVFPGQVRNKPLSNMAMEMMLRRMKVDDATVHGFRSSFRDWAGNVSNFPREVVETALAHVIGDKAEQAYRRSDALEKRRKLMDHCAAYCSAPTTGKVR